VGALLAGLVIGLGSGAVPGPLVVLAISTTLRRGVRSGLLVACGPLVSDALIIAVSLTVVTALPSWARVALGIVGSAVVAYFGVETWRAARTVDVSAMREEAPHLGRLPQLIRHPLVQSTAVNLLNPAPWLFWFTAGAALLADYWATSPAIGVAYLVAFYVGLVGAKVAVVVGVAAGRRWLTTRAYRRILFGCAAALIILAIVLAIRSILEAVAP